jgi:hypothetical protein
MKFEELPDESAERRLSHGGAVHVFPAVHQRKQSAQDAGLDFIRHRVPARRHVHERGATFGDFLHEFLVHFVRRLTEGGGPPHFVTFLLDKKSEV